VLLSLGVGAAVFVYNSGTALRDANWRNYQSKNGYFAIDLPQEPELNVANRSGKYQTVSVDMGRDGGRYFVTYRDFPKDYHLKGQSLVDDEANMLVTIHSGHGADQLERRKVCDKIGCHVAGTVRLNGKNAFLFGRLCIRDERVFIVYWMGPSRKGSEHLDRFFTSFELTKDPNKKSFAERVRDRVKKQSD